MFILYIPMAILAALIGGLTMLFSPILALFVQADGNLPKYLYWFQTFDATCDDCRKPPFSWTGSLWWTRTKWLFRNPAYGFDMFCFGIPFNMDNWWVVKDTPDCFFAYTNSGMFSFRGKYFKWGWKAWAGLSGVPNKDWLKYGRVPIVVLR